MIATNLVKKISDGEPNTITLLESGKIDYILSTDTHGRDPRLASVQMRRLAIEHAIPVFTSVDTARAMLRCLSMNQTMDDVELVDITKL